MVRRLTTLLPVSDVTADALDAEDQKIITLARSTRARVAASEGAAVRIDWTHVYGGRGGAAVTSAFRAAPGGGDGRIQRGRAT